MKTINKIIAYCKEVQKAAAKEANELDKNNEDYDAGKFCVASAVLKIVSEPEPPKLRPMSELPKGDNQVLFVVSDQKKDTWNYGIGSPFQLEAISVNNQSYFKNKDYSAKWSSTKLIGWLPLPNPNDIKL